MHWCSADSGRACCSGMFLICATRVICGRTEPRNLGGSESAGPYGRARRPRGREEIPRRCSSNDTTGLSLRAGRGGLGNPAEIPDESPRRFSPRDDQEDSLPIPPNGSVVVLALALTTKAGRGGDLALRRGYGFFCLRALPLVGGAFASSSSPAAAAERGFPSR